MLANMGIGRWVSLAVLAMVVVAVWKVNDGNLGNIVDAIWSFINWGADTISGLWEKFIASGSGDSPPPEPAPAG